MFQLSHRSRGKSDDLYFVILDLYLHLPVSLLTVFYPCYVSISSFILKHVLDLWKWICIALLDSTCPFE